MMRVNSFLHIVYLNEIMPSLWLLKWYLYVLVLKN